MEHEPQVDEIDWSLFKSKNETPCCGQSVRVKIVEPGPQVRKCSLCKQVNTFVLEPMSVGGLNKLRLRWLTDTEVEVLNQVEGDLDISDL